MINFIHSFNKHCLLANTLLGTGDIVVRKNSPCFRGLQPGGGGNKGQSHR